MAGPPCPEPPPLPPYPVAASHHRRRGLSGAAWATIAAAGLLLAAGAGWLGYRFLTPGPPSVATPPAIRQDHPAPEPWAPSGSSPAPAEEQFPSEDRETGNSVPPPADAPEVDEGAAGTSPASPSSPMAAARESTHEPKDGRADDPAPPAAPSSPVMAMSAPVQMDPAIPEPSPSAPPDSAPLTAAPVGPPEPAPVPAAPEEPAVVFSRTYECRKTAEFHVDPESALVTVDGREIGKADRWDGMFFRKGYEFPGPGTYAVKLSLQGYRTEWVKIVVGPEAKKATAMVELELAEEP